VKLIAKQTARARAQAGTHKLERLPDVRFRGILLQNTH